jgi:hypothetical protein
MPDWKNILANIYDYQPEIGWLFVVPNVIWNNDFAHNKSKDELHPAVVGQVFSDTIRCRIIPGTTKEYQKGTCVFKTKIEPNNPDCPTSHFLINFWMTYLNKDLAKLKRGWNNVDSLNEEQVNILKQQIKFCTGIDV